MVALATALLLGTSQSARADLELALSVDGNLYSVVATAPDFTSLSFSSPTYNGIFKVNMTGGSSDNDATLSDLLGSTTSVKNLTGSTHTIAIKLTETNYTLPAGSPLVVESALGGSFNTGGSVGLAGIFQAYADKSNTLFGTSDYTNGPQNAVQNGTSFSTGSASGIFFRTGTYSVTSITTLVVDAGTTVGYQNHVNLNPVPEPGTMAAALIGLALVGGYRLRRRGA